ncbi:uncharacterized protein LOC104443521 isoform X1 [Eucalyptus grandis]|uniref:uncharacterized protein LOC104443521 isoform X1 n=1 Tax=Eucalyptus grandis TaxID=71139 RepID=UPI00192EB675|nr:uncharacterized protein LOC104443521 isoform X1 [Eucalyptus grandis]XP_018730155.2 uncharacterized protein LOC104443521 isoform X1 [Eucalyptus grandis]
MSKVTRGLLGALRLCSLDGRMVVSSPICDGFEKKLINMGNRLAHTCADENVADPIETTFKLPSPLPAWPSGSGFATGTIDFGGLQVCQVSSFNKIWATHEGGPNNLGATFFEPSQVPEGFSVLGFYCQPNNQALHGWVLVGKDETDDPSNGALKEPIDYAPTWNSESSQIKKDGNGYIWCPIPPEGYAAVGHVVTTSPEKPSTDKIQCVRLDFTDQCESDMWIWGPGKAIDPNGINMFTTRPKSRGTQARGACLGTFVAKNGGKDSPHSLTCLKNNNPDYAHFLPNLSQIEALFQAYAPVIYFHPEESYFPSSVDWFFSNGALLYHKGEESNPIKIEPTGSNLPQGSSNDGEYWLDLPGNGREKDTVKRGDLQSSQAYLHVKPMNGATFSDIAIWLFYPFNGPATAKVKFFDVSLGQIGQHVGDWEHVTLRVSNFTGELWRVYFSQHSKGVWVSASELEFHSGNKIVVYSSQHGHATYSKPGSVLQGNGGIGLRNDTKKSKNFMDTGVNYSVVAVDYPNAPVTEPPWLNYFRKWGPRISYNLEREIKKVEKLFPRKLKSAFEKFVRGLPGEILGEEGPTGPKVKSYWSGDEP